MNKMLELQATKDSIDDIKNSESMIFPIGSEAHAYGKIINKNKLIVEVGAGICLEKSFEEAKDILSKRIEEMQNVLTNLQRDVEQNISALDHLRPEINSSQEYSQAD